MKIRFFICGRVIYHVYNQSSLPMIGDNIVIDDKTCVVRSRIFRIKEKTIDVLLEEIG